MRLGIDAWGLGGDLLTTGMGQYTRHLLTSLSALDPQLAIVAYGGPAEERPGWLPVEVEWRAVGRRMPGKLTALHSRTVALPAQVRRDRLDIFHATAVHMRPVFPPVPRLRCPVVVTLHDLIPQTYYRVSTLPLRQQVFYRWNLRRAVTSDRLVTVSEHSRGDIVSRLGIDRDRVEVIHNGVDFPPNPDERPLARLGLRRPYLLYAGSYEPRKNLAGALRAFRSLVDRGHPHELVAIVEPVSGHRAAAIAELESLGVSNRVHLVHSLDEPDLRSVYTAADLVLFPSLAEGFGYPPVQAASAGVPVVASDLPVLREVMGDAAIYAAAGSVERLVEAVESVLTDPALRARQIEAGRRRAQQFTLTRNARAHLELYVKVVDEGAARAQAAAPSQAAGVQA
jgi:glycosyltransferase involved in cell wall biosynthesis